MFKYKVKCVGWEYRIYRKKHWIGFWQDEVMVVSDDSGNPNGWHIDNFKYKE